MPRVAGRCRLGELVLNLREAHSTAADDARRVADVRRWRMFGRTGFAAAFAVASMVMAVAPTAGAEPSASVSLGPVSPTPFAPFSVTASVTGCPPDDAVTLQVGRSNLILGNDAIDPAGEFPAESAAATANSAGDATVEVSIDTGYPGSWRAVIVCGGTSVAASWEIERPPDFVMTVAPTELTFDVPTELVVLGSGCTGSEVVVVSSRPPMAEWASGRATPSVDGTWETTVVATVPGTASAVLDDRAIPVSAQCVYADGARVDYLSADIALVDGTPPAPAPTPPAAVVISPDFTG